MKLLAFMAAIAIGAAQTPPAPKVGRMLESFTVVISKTGYSITVNLSEGEKDADGEYQIKRILPEYVINVGQSRMEVEGGKRGFDDPEEAGKISAVLDAVSQYVAESVVWWDRGKGLPLDEKGKPLNQPAPTKNTVRASR